MFYLGFQRPSENRELSKGLADVMGVFPIPRSQEAIQQKSVALDPDGLDANSGSVTLKTLLTLSLTQFPSL